MNIYLPEQITKYTDGKSFVCDNTGFSGSKVLIYDDMVLKIGKFDEQTYKTVDVIKWMSDKLPVPEIICFVTENDLSYILMGRIKGKMSCDECYMERSDDIVNILAKGIKILQTIDISSCPREITFYDEIATVQYYVENNLIDENAIDYDLLEKFGLNDVRELLCWLKNNIPEYEPVLSHGDYCMPNVIIDNDMISGFIDLGEAAVSDKWKDIAMCYISLKNNFSGVFGGKIHYDFNPDILFEKLNIEPCWHKLNFYFLLNELFKTK